MTNEPVQIIYLNGPSSSGKTTLAKALQHAFEEPFLHVGIDKIIGWMPDYDLEIDTHQASISENTEKIKSV